MKNIETTLKKIPFDLEKALAGEPCGTRDGKRRVHAISALKKVTLTYCVHVVFEDELDESHEYTLNGQEYTDEESDNDILMWLPSKKLYFAVAVETTDSFEHYHTLSRLFESENGAREYCKQNKMKFLRALEIEVPE